MKLFIGGVCAADSFEMVCVLECLYFSFLQLNKFCAKWAREKKILFFWKRVSFVCNREREWFLDELLEMIHKLHANDCYWIAKSSNRKIILFWMRTRAQQYGISYLFSNFFPFLSRSSTIFCICSFVFHRFSLQSRKKTIININLNYKKRMRRDAARTMTNEEIADERQRNPTSKVNSTESSDMKWDTTYS